MFPWTPSPPHHRAWGNLSKNEENVSGPKTNIARYQRPSKIQHFQNWLFWKYVLKHTYGFRCMRSHFRTLALLLIEAEQMCRRWTRISIRRIFADRSVHTISFNWFVWNTLTHIHTQASKTRAAQPWCWLLIFNDYIYFASPYFYSTEKKQTINKPHKKFTIIWLVIKLMSV